MKVIIKCAYVNKLFLSLRSYLELDMNKLISYISRGLNARLFLLTLVWGLVMINTTTFGLSDGVKAKTVNLLIISRIPDEAIPVFEEMMLKNDFNNVISSFESEIEKANIGLIIVFDWSDLLTMKNVEGGEVLFDLTKSIDEKQNIIRPRVQLSDDRKIPIVVYNIGESSRAKYECLSKDFFLRLNGDRQGNHLNLDTCQAI